MNDSQGDLKGNKKLFSCLMHDLFCRIGSRAKTELRIEEIPGITPHRPRFAQSSLLAQLLSDFEEDRRVSHHGRFQ